MPKTKGGVLKLGQWGEVLISGRINLIRCCNVKLRKKDSANAKTKESAAKTENIQRERVKKTQNT